MSEDPRNEFHLTAHINRHLNKISHSSQLLPIASGVSRKQLLHWRQNISNDINKKVGPLSEQWNSPTLSFQCHLQTILQDSLGFSIQGHSPRTATWKEHNTILCTECADYNHLPLELILAPHGSYT